MKKKIFEKEKIKIGNLEIVETIKSIIKRLKIRKKIFNKAKKYQLEKIFFSLGPKDNVDQNDIYYNKFMTAIEKGSKIIAFTGAYGIGKTSIINSIIKKLKDDNIIKISLGHYVSASDESTTDLKKTDDNGTPKKENKNNIDINDIEIKILQQIIYTTNEDKLPLSRFKRINCISKRKKYIYGIISAIILLIIEIYYSKVYDIILKKPFELYVLYLPEKYYYIIILVMISAIWFIIYKVLMLLRTTIHLTTLKYKNLEISISADDNGSIFNKYLDEIVYFFKQTKTKILVIEDLDRYGNVSLEVFEKLKELNYLLNSNETIKK